MHPPPRARCELDKDDVATWHVDPLRCALPAARSLQLFTLYGVGLPTERSYQYINYVTPRARALPCCGVEQGRVRRMRDGPAPLPA